MAFGFSKVLFKKLVEGAFAVLSNGLGYKKLTVESLPTQDPPLAIDPDNFDLRILGLKPGTYTITVRSYVEGLIESEDSNSVIYECQITIT